MDSPTPADAPPVIVGTPDDDERRAYQAMADWYADAVVKIR